MDRPPLRLILEAVMLAALYFALGDYVFSHLPFSTPPSAWLGLWASRSSGVLAWLLLLNALGSLAAAAPVAILVLWRFPNRRYSLALLTAAPTAAWTLIGYPCCSLPGFGWTGAVWRMEAPLFCGLLLSVPALVWLVGQAPLTIGWSGRER